MAIHASKRSSPPWRRHNNSCLRRLARHSKRNATRRKWLANAAKTLLSPCGSLLLERGRHSHAPSVNSTDLDYKRKDGVQIQKCLVLVSPPRQHDSMTTKNYICIIAGAALLVSCTPTTTTNPAAPATSATGATVARPTPTPRPRPTPRPLGGKRTETGTVIGLTATQITLQTSSGAATWIISRTDSCTAITAGTLAVGNTVTITFCVPPGRLAARLEHPPQGRV